MSICVTTRMAYCLHTLLREHFPAADIAERLLNKHNFVAMLFAQRQGLVIIKVLVAYETSQGEYDIRQAVVEPLEKCLHLPPELPSGRL